MKAVTYFADVACLRDNDMITLWRRSWERHGWDAVVLSEQDAVNADLDLFEILQDSPLLKSCPGNPPDYVLACVARWVAYMGLGPEPALHLDWDVIGNGFTPDDALRLMDGDRPVFLAGDLCPCATLGTGKTWAMLAHWMDMAPYAPGFSAAKLLTDNSDQYAIAYVMPKEWATIARPAPCKFVREGEDWEHAPMIHFPNRLCGHPRSATVRSVMAQLGRPL